MSAIDKGVAQLGQLAMPKILIIGVVATLAYFFALYDNGATLDMQIEQLNGEMRKEQAEAEKIKGLLAQEEAARNEVVALGEQVKEALKKLPTELTASDVVKTITQVAQSAGVRIVKVATKPKEQTGFYEKFILDLSLQGTFAELISFLSELAKMPRIIKSENFTMALLDSNSAAAVVTPIPHKRGGLLVTLQGEILAFRYLENSAASDKQDKLKEENAAGNPGK